MISVYRRATRTFRAALRGWETPLLTHPDSSFQKASASLARYVSGSQFNERDGVDVWREQDPQEHRTVVHPGVVTIRDAGLIGHTRRIVDERRSVEAIVNIVDSAGRPLFFPFKKHWDLRSSAKYLDLLFSRPREGRWRRFALLGSSQVSYYHFVTEVVGDWWFLKQMGYSEADFSAVVVHGHRKKWQEQILDMLRIPAEKRRYHFEVKQRHVELVLPYRTKGGAGGCAPWVCDALWSELGKGLVNRAGDRKLYISRGDAPRRKMLNETDLTEKLTNFGYEVLQLEGMTIAEQQALFGSAGVVVGEHGAALTNLVWCPPGATVVDIHPRVPAMPCFKILAESRGLRYIPIFVSPSKVFEHDDWTIGAEAIDRVLDVVQEL